MAHTPNSPSSAKDSARPTSLAQYRLRPRCWRCGRRLAPSAIDGHSHHPPRVYCPTCALLSDLERGDSA